jgi:tripartite ATP-independent transporter DctP family solute receptor
MKNIGMLARAAAIAGAIGLAGIQGASAETVLKLGHALAPNHPFNIGMELTAKLIAERTNGRVKMEIFPSSQLGTERDMHISIKTGALDMLLASPGGASVHLKELAVLDAPYLFRHDDKHWRDVVYGDIGKEFAEKTLKAANVHIVGWFFKGTRHVISRKTPYAHIAEIKGQKIRVADFEPFPTVFRSFGATPTPIAFAEMYNALQSGVVDGADVPLDSIQAMKLYEVATQVTLIGWSYAAPGIVLMSDDAYNRLSPEDRDIVMAAIKEGTDKIAELMVGNEAQVKADLVSKGIVFTDPANLDEWQDAAAKGIPELAKLWGGDAALYDRIKNVQ